MKDILCIGTALVDSIIKGFDEKPVSATGFRAESGTLNVGGEAVNEAVTAVKLGMKTVWVRQGYAVYQSIDDESKRPDYVVDSIEELRELGEKFFENN